MLGSHRRAIYEDAQVLRPKTRRIRQADCEGIELPVPCVFKLISNFQMDAAWRACRNEDIRLPLIEMEARTKWMNAARCDKHPGPEQRRG